MTPRYLRPFDPRPNSSPTGPQRRLTEEEPHMTKAGKKMLARASGVAAVALTAVVLVEKLYTLTGKKWA